ncbi:type I restriction enzyme HsdR N-terminal domain-containing protein [Porphyromonas loveana]|uniref:type I restriction enzyme HsdR N-terminal domain-containing protein n=1 Tax=Porphyromonas loveana TaxID=1884669 RepID=UPI0035A0268B
MIQLNLPPYAHRISQENDRMLIYDDIRRRYVALTPEEWVRQHFVHYLTEELGYPATLIRNEAQLQIDRRTKRCDTVIYDTQLRPIVLCEYKAPSVSLSQKTMDQILRYNYIFRVPLLLLSNGVQHTACFVDYTQNSYRFLPEIPTYKELTTIIHTNN